MEVICSSETNDLQSVIPQKMVLSDFKSYKLFQGLTAVVRKYSIVCAVTLAKNYECQYGFMVGPLGIMEVLVSFLSCFTSKRVELLQRSIASFSRRKSEEVFLFHISLQIAYTRRYVTCNMLLRRHKFGKVGLFQSHRASLLL
jgi:hypothetical protein